MCSGRIDPTFVLKAFASGADGVMMTGCWPADCHYRVQNVKALRRFELLQRVLEQLGIEPERFQRVYASAAEGQQLAAAFSRMIEEVRPLGPLAWGRIPEPGDPEAEADLAVLEAVGS
jgi:F420-non-reducing hydrogenase iron-sulfur subunit